MVTYLNKSTAALPKIDDDGDDCKECIGGNDDDDGDDGDDGALCHQYSCASILQLVPVGFS